MKNVLAIAFALSLFAFGCNSDSNGLGDAAPNPAPPNIIFFLIDDIGILSMPTYGNNSDSMTVWSDKDFPTDTAKYNTPNINQIVSESMLFNYMYSTPSCAPSRAQLMTGRYPFRTGIVWPGYSAEYMASQSTPGSGFLDTTDASFANIIQDANYRTGFGGKWNLRYGETDYEAENSGDYPVLVDSQKIHLQALGFDHTFGPSTYDSNLKENFGGAALIGNTVDYHPPGIGDMFFPDTLHSWAKNFVIDGFNNWEENKQPFYLHYCLGLIHDEFVVSNEAFENDTLWATNFAKKVAYADSLIGYIDSLVKSNTDYYENTLIIIAGDNGTERAYYTYYQGQEVSGGKLTFGSHGSRVPFIARWPNVIPADTTYNGLADFADVYATMAELVTGAPATKTTDGTSFLYQLTNGLLGTQPQNPRTAVYSQMNNGNPVQEYRSDPPQPAILRSGAFVANKSYQYRTATETWGDETHGVYPDGSIVKYNTNGLYKISDNLSPDTLLYSTVDSILTFGTAIEQSNFDTLYSYLCYLNPTNVTFDKQICDKESISNLVKNYWEKE